MGLDTLCWIKNSSDVSVADQEHLTDLKTIKEILKNFFVFFAKAFE